MSQLPKHLRPRWRYLAVDVRCWPDVSIDRAALQRSARAACRSLLGDARTAAIDLAVFRFAVADGRGEGIVRVHRDQVDAARAGIACIRRVEDAQVGVHVRGVSGTVRGCEEKYLGRRREPTNQSKVVFADATFPAFEFGDDVDIRVGDAFVGATSLDLE